MNKAQEVIRSCSEGYAGYGLWGIKIVGLPSRGFVQLILGGSGDDEYEGDLRGVLAWIKKQHNAQEVSVLTNSILSEIEIQRAVANAYLTLREYS